MTHWKWILAFSCAALVCATGLQAAEVPSSAKTDAEMFAAVDQIFEHYARDAHAPGFVYGIVAGGKLVHLKTLGVQDLDSNSPVTTDSVFRIASMTKAFTALTILKLRDEGKLSLDALAETYVPEMRDWKYLTEDSPRIRVRDLLNHTAGFVTDDPWGDRQQYLPETEFTRLLREGVPFARAPGLAMEYSNLGYALLGRIIGNVSGKPYAEAIAEALLQPLGMSSTNFHIDPALNERRALGYRWENEAWRPEPAMAHGAFGAMGGMHTTATDYTRWVKFLLSSWPARDGVETGPVRRSTVRELGQGSNFARTLPARPASSGTGDCPRALNYGMGMLVIADCELGTFLSHSGGYPGYGSNVLLLPEHGVGIFAFASRTYAAPSRAVFDAALAMHAAGFLKDRPQAVSPELQAAYEAVGEIFQQGDVMAGADMLAMNFLLDRDATEWARQLASLKQQVGDCDASSALKANHVLSGEFTWTCATGQVAGGVLLAPTKPPRIQALRLAPSAP